MPTVDTVETIRHNTLDRAAKSGCTSCKLLWQIIDAYTPVSILINSEIHNLRIERSSDMHHRPGTPLYIDVRWNKGRETLQRSVEVFSDRKG